MRKIDNKMVKFRPRVQRVMVRGKKDKVRRSEDQMTKESKSTDRDQKEV